MAYTLLTVAETNALPKKVDGEPSFIQEKTTPTYAFKGHEEVNEPN